MPQPAHLISASVAALHHCCVRAEHSIRRRRCCATLAQLFSSLSLMLLSCASFFHRATSTVSI